MEMELGIVADSWSHLGSAVWLVRIKDESVLDRWFPKERRLHDLRSLLGVRFIWTRDGLNLCVRDDVVAIARRGGDRSLMAGVRRLMNDPKGASRDRLADFQLMRDRLPARHLAIADVVFDKDGPADESGAFWLMPSVRRAVIGLYERHGRIELAVSGLLEKPERKTPLDQGALERIVQLPQTTLLAWATTVDFQRAYESATRGPQTGTFGRYLSLLAGLGSDRAVGSKLFDQLGPNVIVVWGQNLSQPGGPPQVALLVQCADARAVRAETTYIAGSLLRLLKSLDPVDESATPKVKLTLHLGTPILHVPLGKYAAASQVPLAKLLARSEPAWATAGDWAIFALSRGHLEQILDAQNELIPTLGSIREVQQLAGRQHQRDGVSVVQPALAADLLDGWLKAYESGAPSLLDESWWTPNQGNMPHPETRLGLVFGDESSPGVVVVEEVIAGSPSDKRLLPKDQIIGLNGALLELTNSGDDLRKKLTHTAAGRSALFRVRRAGSMVDVELAASQRPSGIEGLLLRPADALHELAAMGRPLQLAAFEMLASGEERYLAQLTLQFSAAPAP
jgi:hypothetical protein